MSLVVKDFFGLILINRSRGIKYQFLKKLCDVVNKVCAFKFENLSIFNGLPLPSVEPGTNSTFLNLIWRLNEPGDLSFLLHILM